MEVFNKVATLLIVWKRDFYQRNLWIHREIWMDVKRVMREKQNDVFPLSDLQIGCPILHLVEKSL